jgi:two-component system, chemotaxis family, chemotaxis protein CheY
MSGIEREQRTTAHGLEEEVGDPPHTTHESRLLLVDDDDDIRPLLGDFLRSAGYEISEARDGADALAMLHGTISEPAAIITDLAMPRLDGWRFIEAVRADRRFDAILILVVSASAGPPSGVCCLGKPLAPARLIDALAGLGVAPPKRGPSAK